MAGPFKCKRMRIQIVIRRSPPASDSTYTLGVVEAYDIELIREGGVTPHYDSEIGKHAIGTRHATFRLRRWYVADAGQEDLIYDLFQGDGKDPQQFDMSGEIVGMAGSTITLISCCIYSYSPRTGGANDIVAEEARGEARDWKSNI